MATPITDLELASRLSFFLWSSLPDAELLALGGEGRLSDARVLEQQVHRMLTDPRIERFARHYTRQWLGMEELDFLKFDAKAHGRVDPLLLEAMKRDAGKILQGGRVPRHPQASPHVPLALFSFI